MVTPMHTRTNAKSVPKVVSCTISSMLALPAKNATTLPASQVVTWGVWDVGCTLAAHRGSRPSRAIEKKMRGWPSWKTTRTEVVANTAPSEMISAGQPMPRAENAVASGSAVPS